MMQALTPRAIATRVLVHLEALRSPAGRRLIGLCGPPAAGKSTVAAALAERLGAHIGAGSVVVVPMDGFHLPDRVLADRGLLDLKGAPETFAAEAFCDRLRDLVETPDRIHHLPLFDRAGAGRIDEALAVTPAHRLVIVEGNYLHLPEPPWQRVRRLYTPLVYLDVPRALVEARLRHRFRDLGWPPAAVDRKVALSDMPNHDLCSATKFYADHVIMTYS